MKLNLPERGLVQFFVNSDDTVGSLIEQIKVEDGSVSHVKLFTYIQKYQNINSSTIVDIKQDLTEDSLLLDALNNTQQAPVFLELDDMLFRFP